MGTIKDLVDLVTQLANSVEDRKLAAELGNIQSQILTLQAEQAGLHEANITLREEKLALKERIQELEAKIKALSLSSVPAPTGVPPCPNCSTNTRPFYMNPVGSQFREMLGGARHECPKCKYRAN